MRKETEKRRLYLKKYKRDWMRKRRQVFFAGKSCVKCGSVERLELDHIDPKTKVTHCVWSWCQERRDVELAKCQVLCHACHLLKSIAQFKEGKPEHGVTGYRNGCRCDVCRIAQVLRQRVYRKKYGRKSAKKRIAG